MKRLAAAATLSALLLAACGGNGGGAPDAADVISCLQGAGFTAKESEFVNQGEEQIDGTVLDVSGEDLVTGFVLLLLDNPDDVDEAASGAGVTAEKLSDHAVLVGATQTLNPADADRIATCVD